MLLPLFAIALFLNACLLFLIQPMVSRMILPLMGGAPAVWTTCMLFFQTVLLLGYLYSHFLTTRLSFRWQTITHFFVLLLPFLVLPLSISGEGFTPGAASATPWLLWKLSLAVGLPFFVVTTTAPLLQRWFSRTQHSGAKDPYFLYSASNFGNMLGLIGYPIIFEQLLRVGQQTALWTWTYGALTLLIAGCGGVGYFRGTDVKPETSREKVEPTTRRQRLEWILLALVPSSLMLGVTNFLTTDIAAIPLLWLIPLTLYLLTFILAFGVSQNRLRVFGEILAPALGFVLFLVIVTELTMPTWLSYLSHLATFFFLALMCHGELAAKRPATAHLTEFYLWISVGGVFGSFLNAIVFPLLFSSVREYPLMLLIACLLTPAVAVTTPRRSDYAWGMGAVAITILVVYAIHPLQDLLDETSARGIASKLPAGFGLTWIPYALALMLPPLFFTWLLDKRQLSYRIAMLALAGATVVNAFAQTPPLHRERSFFGVLSIVDDPDTKMRELRHGTTLHGKQSLLADRRQEPLSYYYRKSPVGDLLTRVNENASPEIAVIGLGAGTVAAYGKPQQKMTFYEIDPGVVKIASDPHFFTYLSEAKQRNVDIKIELGDARIKLTDAKDGQFKLIVADAFSSDAIPVHLVTAEALQLYLSKLAPDGVLAIHVSNKYVDLIPSLSALAREQKLYALEGWDTGVDEDTGYLNSSWVAMTRQSRDLSSLLTNDKWSVIRKSSVPAWHDDFYNFIGALKFDE